MGTSFINTKSLYQGNSNIKFDPKTYKDFGTMNCKNAVRFGVGIGHKISIDGNITNGSVSTASSTECAGMKVTISVAPDDGYYCTGASVNNGAVQVTKNADGTYSFIMPDEDVTISAVFKQSSDLFSVNEAGTEYTIHDAAGRDIFCDYLQDSSYNCFSGKTILLDTSIEVIQKAGFVEGNEQKTAFKGTFDGKGNKSCI